MELQVPNPLSCANQGAWPGVSAALWVQKEEAVRDGLPAICQKLDRA